MQNLRINTTIIFHIIILVLALSFPACKSVNNSEKTMDNILNQDEITRNHFNNCKRKQGFKPYEGNYKTDTINNGQIHLFYDSLNVVFYYYNDSNYNELFYNGLITREVLHLSSMDSIFLESIKDVSDILGNRSHKRSFEIFYWTTKFSHNLRSIFITIKSTERYNQSTLKEFIKTSKLTFASEVFFQI